MRLIEDLLTDEDQAAIGRVFASDTPRFDLLVSLAGLDPCSDFKNSDLRRLNLCGADLRGFDFTGSDLRQCVRNDNTLIDETTILTSAKLEWVEIDALPIYVKMQELETVSSSTVRLRLLNELTLEFGKTTHVVTYMVNAASKAKTLDEFLDLAQFLPRSISETQVKSIRIAGLKLLKRKLAQSKNRTRREKTKIFALESISDKLNGPPGSLAELIYEYLADIVTTKNQTTKSKGMAFIEVEDMEKAFAHLGQKGR